MIPSITAKSLARGAALWNNPFFARMTPAGGFEIALLLLQSLLAGVYVGLPRSPCGKRTSGAGAIIGFLGIACPVCNNGLRFRLQALGAGSLSSPRELMSVTT